MAKKTKSSTKSSSVSAMKASRILTSAATTSIMPKSSILVESNNIIDSKLTKNEIIDIIISDLLKEFNEISKELTLKLNTLKNKIKKQLDTIIEEHFTNKYIPVLEHLTNEIYGKKIKSIRISEIDINPLFHILNNQCRKIITGEESNSSCHYSIVFAIYYNKNNWDTFQFKVSKEKIDELVKASKIDFTEVLELHKNVVQCNQFINSNKNEMKIHITKELIAKSPNGQDLNNLINNIKNNTLKSLTNFK